MNPKIEEEKLYKDAQKRVRRLKSFYTHVATYFIVGTFLTFVNWYTNPGYWWVIWVWAGWGIGILFHGLGLYKRNILFSEGWEDKKIKEEMEKMRK